uniref:MARVEL domain-containing protein n=1 Tax=Anopheles atroparvus TaxID=41427 RepID=A0AAG5DX30_ANOAO
MTQIFAQLPAGQPGDLIADKQFRSDDRVLDVPVIDSPTPAHGNVPAGGFGAACAGLLTGSRAEMRSRARVLQLLLTIGALAFNRPQLYEPLQWVNLLVLVHTFIISFVLLWDKRYCGTIVRKLLPLVDWRTLDMRYTCTVSVLLYVLFYGLVLSHKGYGGNVWCNWVSAVLSLLTALVYSFDSWLLLQNAYGGRPPTDV